ncbi:peptidoglycan DD-metalloendopeptidase family protein [Candidatus Pandoraea novymonadis]|uniref:peptidoglycan DD-metalloendopeptidase family protein n=1 Tax=Candidatus Pandoraea novymonadis TaxID=1808959 RepID=UPI000D06ABD5|nr:peptidoglycan DD-metalloendopeptidase family protein [Candidatus Pandoraea novymonadis]
MNFRAGFYKCIVSVLLLSMVPACSTRQVNAPIVDRTIITTVSRIPPAVDYPPVPPGYYRVKSGDGLYRIALDNGQNYHDIARWNNITNPDQIEVGQVLCMKAPIGERLTLMPQSGILAAPADSLSNNRSSSVSRMPAASAASVPTSEEIFQLAWPARGNIVAAFNDRNNKGLNIAGNVGDPVLAANAGKVVYSGAGLRGYGNLIIIKHNAVFLTAYAHNKSLLVKEGDSVISGQKIAEMGNSDASRVMLHFEVRRDGKPVDPIKYLKPQ